MQVPGFLSKASGKNENYPRKLANTDTEIADSWRFCVAGVVGTDNDPINSEDIRYGTPTTWEDLYPIIEESADAEEWEVCLRSEGDGFDLGDENPLAARLLETYRSLSESANAVPFRSGGGTYARHLPNAFSHGLIMRSLCPSIVDILGKGHGSAHGPDECLPVDAYLAAIRVLIGFAETVSDFLINE